MTLPENIATLRGAELLTELSRFCEDLSVYYAAAGNRHWHDAFHGLADGLLMLKFRQEDHIHRMAEKRAKGERVWRETDETVDATVGALRSAFIRTASDHGSNAA